MKLKLDANGNVVTKDVNGIKMPVYVRDNGEELEFDAAGTVATISRLNGEAKQHREAKEAAEGKLAAYKDIPDPAKALEALKAVKTIDLNKLVDAGEVERVRTEVASVYEEQLATIRGENEGLKSTLYDREISAVFSGSKFVKDKLAIPADMAQARFGSAFGIENGIVYAVDGAGNKLLSRVRPGEVADAEEALELLVTAYPHRDSILKGSGKSGGGAQGGSGGGGSRTIQRKEFDGLDPVSQRSKLAEGVAVVD